MSLLKEALDAGKFGITAEMAPPKGYDFTEQMEAAELLRGKVHAVNVTDMQSASLKATGLGLCIKLKQAGVEPILQMTGRDRNRMALMGDALAAAAFGIDTMLALTGDHPVVGDCKDSKPVYDLDSVGILDLLTVLFFCIYGSLVLFTVMCVDELRSLCFRFFRYTGGIRT